MLRASFVYCLKRWMVVLLTGNLEPLKWFRISTETQFKGSNTSFLVTLIVNFYCNSGPLAHNTTILDMESAISQQDSLSHSTHEYQFENNLHRNNIRNRMNKAILEIFRRFVYPANLTTRNPNTIKGPIKLSTVQWTLIILLNRFLTLYKMARTQILKLV